MLKTMIPIPMKTSSQSTFPQSLAALFAILAFAASPVHAATFTWDGGGANDLFSTAANWNPDAVPPTTASDYVFTDDSLRASPNLGAAGSGTTTEYSFVNLTFGGSGGFTINGGAANQQGGRLGLGAGTASIFQNSTGNAVINAPIVLAGNGLEIKGSGAGLLTLNSFRLVVASQSIVTRHNVTLGTISSGTSTNVITLTVGGGVAVTLSDASASFIKTFNFTDSTDSNFSSNTLQTTAAGGLTSTANVVSNLV
jgi:hypothetical protein